MSLVWRLLNTACAAALRAYLSQQHTEIEIRSIYG